jgi:hypothetical protein
MANENAPQTSPAIYKPQSKWYSKNHYTLSLLTTITIYWEYFTNVWQAYSISIVVSKLEPSLQLLHFSLSKHSSIVVANNLSFFIQLICSSNHEGVIIIYKAPGTHPTPRVSMSVSTMFSAKAPSSTELCVQSASTHSTIQDHLFLIF